MNSMSLMMVKFRTRMIGPENEFIPNSTEWAYNLITGKTWVWVLQGGRVTKTERENKIKTEMVVGVDG